MAGEVTSGGLSRAQVIRSGSAFAAALAVGAAASGRNSPKAQPPPARPRTMPMRPIPSSGRALPVVGLGTYINFDVTPGSEAYRALPAVLDALFAAGRK